VKVDETGMLHLNKITLAQIAIRDNYFCAFVSFLSDLFSLTIATVSLKSVNLRSLF